MISRDWRCLNPRCGTVFHSFEKANPPCPTCGCVRVDWVPGGGHIMDMAPRVDKRLRTIADQQNMTNLNSVSHSRASRAAPILNKPPPPGNPEFGNRAYGGTGLSAPLSRQYDPLGDIYCVPSASAVSVGGKVAIGSIATNPRSGEQYNNAMAPPRGEVSPMMNTVVHARHAARQK